MRSKDNIFRICFRGIYSCYWKRSSENKPRHACCWFSFLFLVSILMLGWMYTCFVAYNDQSDVNWKAFQIFHYWENWFMIVVILSAILAIYCLLLLFFSLFQFAIKEPLDLHWLHKVLLFFGLLIVVLGTAGISCKWKEEWSSVSLSLQATGPFLQLGAVVALTLISWLVFQSYHRAQRAVSKVLIIGAFVAVSAVVFFCPLFIHSPCLVETLPPKPALVGHRGAPVVAPENTMMSFEKSLECNVTAFETDVQLSKNLVPFLMHDDGKNFLKRTTDVEVKFNTSYSSVNNFTWEDLQRLNAGKWFTEDDPFWSASLLSAAEKAQADNQTVPSLSELLSLAKNHSVSVIFDLKNTEQNCIPVVETILKSNISQDLIWWLPPACRAYVKTNAQGFRRVYKDVSEMKKDNGTFLNVRYSELRAQEIRELRESNVTVNLWAVNERWLFSLMWCSGASSVTTNTCHILKDISQPDWHMSPHLYSIIWITADLVSLFMMVILFFLQRKKRANNQIFHRVNEKTVPLLTI